MLCGGCGILFKIVVKWFCMYMQRVYTMFGVGMVFATVEYSKGGCSDTKTQTVCERVSKRMEWNGMEWVLKQYCSFGRCVYKFNMRSALSFVDRIYHFCSNVWCREKFSINWQKYWNVLYVPLCALSILLNQPTNQLGKYKIVR